MSQHAGAAGFWERYCASHPDAERCGCRREDFEVWPFGDGPELADQLGQLVVHGTKTATAGLLWDEEASNTVVPKAGAKAVILDGHGRPLCVIEYTEVTVKPFREVDDAFAELEGEGFRTIDDWRQAHWRFFAQRCTVLNREPTELMPVICQRFRVLFPFPQSTILPQYR